VAQGTTNAVHVFLVNSDVSVASSHAVLGSSNIQPAIACGNPEMLAGFVMPGGRVRIRRSNDGAAWTDSVVPEPLFSAIPPTLTYVPWMRWYMLVTTDPGGTFHYYISRDGGRTFKLSKDITNYRTSYAQIGFCVPYAASCGMFAPRVMGGQLAMYQSFEPSDPNGIVRSAYAAGQNNGQTFGGAAAVDETRTEPSFGVAAYANLIRSKAVAGRVFASEILAQTGSAALAVSDFDTGLISDSAPSVTYDPQTREWRVWGTYDMRYNFDFVPVPFGND
jgi:hypothetical protein